MASKKQISHSIIRLLDKNVSMTRNQLNNTLNLRPASLFAAINNLKDLEIICEPMRTGKKTGRKASPIFLNPEYAYILGIEIEPGNLTAVILDLQGKRVKQSSRQIERGKSRTQVLIELLDFLQQFRQSIPQWEKIVAVGFSDPGLVDMKTGISIRAVNFPDWENFWISPWFEKHFALSATPYSATTSRAFRETLTPANMKFASLFLLELTTGVGGGFVKEGKPYFGDSACAMEVGHIIVEADGPVCRCGNHGCLETIAGMFGIQRQINEIIASGVETSLREDPTSIKHFCKCVIARDKAALGLILKIGHAVGCALATIVTILNPSAIILSGPLTACEDVLINIIKQTLGLCCHPQALDTLHLDVSHLDQFTAAEGSAMLVREQVILNLNVSTRCY